VPRMRGARCTWSTHSYLFWQCSVILSTHLLTLMQRSSCARALQIAHLALLPSLLILAGPLVHVLTRGLCLLCFSAIQICPVRQHKPQQQAQQSHDKGASRELVRHVACLLCFFAFC
jgi:hypothetical protein